MMGFRAHSFSLAEGIYLWSRELEIQKVSSSLGGATG